MRPTKLSEFLILCATVITVVVCNVTPEQLIGNFDLVGGPLGCPSVITTTRVRPISARETVEIDVPNIALGGTRCAGDGYVIMARQDGRISTTVRSDKLLTAVRRRGGGGGGGGGGRGSSSGGGGGRPSGSSSGGSRPSGGSSGGIRGITSSISRPRPGSISRPTTSKPLPVKGSRIRSGGTRGIKWLGTAFVASSVWRGAKGSKWRKRRKSMSGDDDDEVSELSESLDNLGVPHYYGYHAQPLLAEQPVSVANFTRWGFQCGKYGAEFRTRFLYFRVGNDTFRGFDDFFSPEVNYLVISGTTIEGESTRNPEIPCIYTSREHSTGKHGTRVQEPDCLPGDALVTMKDGKEIRVDELNEGNSVAIGNEVFLFTHRDAKRVATFLRFVTTDGRALELTHGHYLYANGEYRAARYVRIGDMLRRADGNALAVSDISEVVKTGVYNPQTVQGDIVVSGFVVSTYTEAVTPGIAHSALSPLRAVWRVLGWSSQLLYGGMPSSLQSSTV